MHKIQKLILKMLNERAHTYSDLYKTLGVRSNLFDYHLRVLLKQGLITKLKNKYKLTSVGQSISPYLDIGKQPIVAVVLAILTDGNVALLKRGKHAFHGHWAIPGGKVRFGETAEKAAERICLDETGLEMKSAEYVATVQELVREDGGEKHHFILLLYRVKTSGELKRGKFFPLDKLPRGVVPSDARMLRIVKAKLFTSVINEDQGRLKQELFE